MELLLLCWRCAVPFLCILPLQQVFLSHQKHLCVLSNAAMNIDVQLLFSVSLLGCLCFGLLVKEGSVSGLIGKEEKNNVSVGPVTIFAFPYGFARHW